MNTNFHTESRMREICTYGSMRGRAYPTRGVPLYSTPHAHSPKPQRIDIATDLADDSVYVAKA